MQLHKREYTCTYAHSMYVRTYIHSEPTKAIYKHGTHMYAHVHTHVRMYTCLHARAHAHVHTHTHAVHKYIHAYILTLITLSTVIFNVCIDHVTFVIVVMLRLIVQKH